MYNYMYNVISERIIYKWNSNKKLNIFGFSNASYITVGNSKSANILCVSLEVINSIKIINVFNNNIRVYLIVGL
jgi:hypothetical protein